MSLQIEASGIWFEFIEDQINWSKLYLSPLEIEYLNKDSLAPKRKLEFALTRHVLRVELDRRTSYTGPVADFVKSKHGKLYVNSQAYGGYHFSLSHCSGASLIVVDPADELGCDIERIDRPVKSQDLLEKRICSEEELRYLEGVTSENRKSEFLRIWTRKESYSKMTGRGLGEDFHSFSVLNDSLEKDGQQAFLSSFNEDAFVFSVSQRRSREVSVQKVDVKNYLDEECLQKS